MITSFGTSTSSGMVALLGLSMGKGVEFERLRSPRICVTPYMENGFG